MPQPDDSLEARITVADIDASPVNVPVTGDMVPREMYNGLLAKFTQVSDEKTDLLQRIDALNKTTSAVSILNAMIEPYAKRAFGFMCAYSIFVALAVIGQGFKLCGFSIDAEVMKYLVGSTAATVIGLVGMVLTGIFVGARKAE